MALGIYYITNGTSTLGTIVYIFTTMRPTIHSLWFIMDMYNETARNLVAVVRMKELLDEKEDIKNSPNAIALESTVGDLEFRDVVFSYSDKSDPILNNFNLWIIWKGLIY